eukprot:TRINITY_DN14663_c0_g1_i1.p1 TRINITY_DN14663_c0_g1~~TRINITY_DN14663_c0_g1_i1.p1  ORF type:complete len:350 (+),score=34.02 TRINITY_DN14663_c0_g1_i1:69-1052(+)
MAAELQTQSHHCANITARDNGSQDAKQTVEIQRVGRDTASLSSPCQSPRPIGASFGFGFEIGFMEEAEGGVTPDFKTTNCFLSQQRGPRYLQKALREDLEDALDIRSPELVEMALIRSCGCYKSHCLHEAVRRKHLRCVEFLLEQRETEVNVSCGGMRPLQLALGLLFQTSPVGHRILDLLVSHGEQIECKDTFYSPLCDAARRHDDSAVTWLLSRGANPSLTIAKGLTPLHVACQSASGLMSLWLPDIISKLLAAGASALQEDEQGLRPRQHIRNHDNDLCAVLRRVELHEARCLLLLMRNTTQTSNLMQATLHLPGVVQTVASFI